jgi:hypothetical protein
MSAYDDTHLIENVSNMPVVMENGVADPLASQPLVALTLQEMNYFGDIGYRSFNPVAHSHADPAAALTQCLVSALLRRHIDRNPARVVLSEDPTNDPRPAPRGVRLHHGRAYWVSGVRVRPNAPPSPYDTPFGNLPGFGNNAVGRIAVTSLGFAHRQVTATTYTGYGQNVTSGRNFCRVSKRARTNDVWVVRGARLNRGPARPAHNEMQIALREVSVASLALPRMRLSTDRRLILDVTGDGPTTLRLRGPWRGSVSVAAGGRVTRARARHGVLSVRRNYAHIHKVVITPR